MLIYSFRLPEPITSRTSVNPNDLLVYLPIQAHQVNAVILAIYGRSASE